VFAFHQQFSSERSSHVSQTAYFGTDAAYWVIPADDAFSVEVITPWNYPTTVSPFATATDAKAWIAEHQKRAQSESEPSGKFRSSENGAANRRDGP
jgi:hypothetical protein